MTQKVRWLCLVLCATALASPNPAAQTASPQKPATERGADFWNKEYAEGKALLNKEPSALLIAAVHGRKPGTALDLGMGEGRNAVYLAEKGWTVTGVDLSDVAIAHAKRNAAARGVTLNAVVENLDVFDFGKERWDLMTSFYMHSWHRRSPTDVPSRIYDALKPGGLLVIEGFAEPPNKMGFQTEVLARAFGRLRILQNENVTDHAPWYVQDKVPLVRFVGEKQR